MLLKWTIKAPLMYCEIKTKLSELKFLVEEEGSHVSWEKISLQFNEYSYIYIKSKQTSMNNVLPIEINLLFQIYSSSADWKFHGNSSSNSKYTTIFSFNIITFFNLHLFIYFSDFLTFPKKLMTSHYNKWCQQFLSSKLL